MFRYRNRERLRGARQRIFRPRSDQQRDEPTLAEEITVGNTPVPADNYANSNHATDLALYHDRIKAIGTVKWLASKNFDGNNFHYWMKAIRNHLKAARLWEIVVGIETRPLEPEQARQWDHLDRLAVTILMDSIRDDLLLGITGEETSGVIWQFITEKYHDAKWGTSAGLLGKLTALKMINSSNVNDHLTTIRELSEKLNEMGEGLNCSQLTALLLGSLPENWNTSKSSFWIMKTAPGYDELEANIRTEAGRRGNELTVKRREDKRTLESNLVDANLTNMLEVVQAVRRNFKDVDQVTPTQVKSVKKHNNEVEQIKNRAATSESNSVAMQNESSRTSTDKIVAEQTPQIDGNWSWSGMSFRSNVENEWIVDSGATHHMCFTKSMFLDLKSSSPTATNEVGLPNGGKVSVEGYGKVKLVVKCSETSNKAEILLDNVLYIPKFNRNLLSIPKASAAGLKFDFNAIAGRVVVSCGYQSIVSARPEGKALYFLEHLHEPAAEANALMAQPTFDLWHKRLGHLKPRI
ncbi:hypothetical protein LEN26_009060 [Aphanomyces euteiches]|nr:hypothetical protein AeMF1_012557 [Aphanomyces euteiches]KAH9128902.1 hypothetical protein LEN26_009060 [Aphanomyces euteiches]